MLLARPVTPSSAGAAWDLERSTPLTLQVLAANYSPAAPDAARQEARISGLYLMMGRGLERLQVCDYPFKWPVRFVPVLPTLTAL